MAGTLFGHQKEWASERRRGRHSIVDFGQRLQKCLVNQAIGGAWSTVASNDPYLETVASNDLFLRNHNKEVIGFDPSLLEANPVFESDFGPRILFGTVATKGFCGFTISFSTKDNTGLVFSKAKPKSAPQPC